MNNCRTTLNLTSRLPGQASLFWGQGIFRWGFAENFGISHECATSESLGDFRYS